MPARESCRQRGGGIVVSGLFLKRTGDGPRKDDALTRLSLLERLTAPDEDNQAWQEFVELYVQLILGWCRHWGVSQADVDEVVQETVYQVVKGMSSFRYQGKGSFRAWLQTIAQRCWRRVSRCRIRALGPGELDRSKKKPAGVLNPKYPHDHLMLLFDEWATREILEMAIFRARRRVCVEVWTAYDLAVRHRLSSQEVATLMKIPVKLVYSRVLDFRRVLKQEMRILDPPLSSSEEPGQ